MSANMREYFQTLSNNTAAVLKNTLIDGNVNKLSQCFVFKTDIDSWCTVLRDRKESEIFRAAAEEYEFSMLSLIHGYHRNAFKGLRLTIELALQGVYLSANEIFLREWLSNRADTNWAQLKNEETGVFSRRFVSTFFNGLEEKCKHYNLLAETLYRECSECVHGNMPKDIIIPKGISYSKESLEMWITKSKSSSLLVNFALAMRYLNDLSPSQIESLREVLNENLGHIELIRNKIIH